MVSGTPLSGPHMSDERGVRRRVDGDGLLHQSVEQLPAMARRAPVEAERELVQVVIQVRPRYGPLVRAEEPPFQQGHHAMDPRQQLRGRFLPPLQERDAVAVAVLLQPVVAQETVGSQNLGTPRD